MRFQIGAMTVGDILDRGVKMLFTRLGTFLTINLITYTPVLLVQLLQPLLIQASQTATDQGSTAALTLLAITLFGSLFALIIYFMAVYVGTAAMLHVISKEFVDETVTVGEALKFAWRRAGALFWSLFLVGMLMMLGFVMCIIPGILFAIWYAFVAQVVVVEGLSGPRALARSKELTEGYRWRVLGLSLLMFLINLAVVAPFALVELILPSNRRVIGPGGLPRAIPIYPNYFINIALMFIPTIVIAAYYSICFTLFYFDLRIRKEGFDLLLLAKPKLAPDDELA